MKTKESLTEKELESKTKEEVFCNKCGMSCRGHIGNFNGLIEQRIHFNGLIKEKVVGGYDSTHIDDDDVYLFSLCERCLMELISTFKLSAKYGNYLFPEPYTGVWEELPEYDKWKAICYLNDADIIDFFEMSSVENLRKGYNLLSSTDSMELSPKMEEVISLLKKYLSGKQ